MQKVHRFSWEAVENSVFRQMCDTQTPQGILTVLRQPSYLMEDLLKEKNPVDQILRGFQKHLSAFRHKKFLFPPGLRLLI